MTGCDANRLHTAESTVPSELERRSGCSEGPRAFRTHPDPDPRGTRRERGSPGASASRRGAELRGDFPSGQRSRDDLSAASGEIPRGEAVSLGLSGSAEHDGADPRRLPHQLCGRRGRSGGRLRPAIDRTDHVCGCQPLVADSVLALRQAQRRFRIRTQSACSARAATAAGPGAPSELRRHTGALCSGLRLHD